MNDTVNKKNKSLTKPVRILLISLGTIFIAIGVAGIFIPILPTTPLILLATALYARSSEKFYLWLLSNKIFGRHIKNYREKRGISIWVKVFTLSLLWVTISLSIFLGTEILWVRILLFIIAVGVTIHILSIKTLKE